MSTSAGQTSGKDTAIGCGTIIAVIMLISVTWAACSACKGSDDGGGGGGSGSGGSYRYTLADYQMIDVGMSRSEVKSILGSNGEPVEGYPEQRIYINDDDFSNIVVEYQGDVVVNKAQAGL